MKDIALQQRRSKYSLNKILLLYGIKKSTWHGWQRFSEFLPPAPRTTLRQNNRKLLKEEEDKIVAYRRFHPEVGYRKLCWMMNDAKEVFVTETAMYRVLKKNGMLWGFKSADSKGTQKEYRNKPLHVHHHWHTDIAYVKIRGTFYFLIMLLDGYSRFLLHWNLMTDMTKDSVAMFIQEAREKYPHAKPVLINDNGSAFISLDFKRLLSRLEVQQVFTRRNHPQTNGKAERLVGLIRQEALRPRQPDSFAEAYTIIDEYSYRYNYQRLHAGIKFLRPADMFFGRDQKILAERNENLRLARLVRIETNRRKKDLSIGGREAEPLGLAQAPRSTVDKSAFI